MNVFNWRADGLDLKVDMSYEDHVGPVALVGSILGALLLSGIHAVHCLDMTAFHDFVLVVRGDVKLQLRHIPRREEFSVTAHRIVKVDRERQRDCWKMRHFFKKISRAPKPSFSEFVVFQLQILWRWSFISMVCLATKKCTISKKEFVLTVRKDWTSPWIDSEPQIDSLQNPLLAKLWLWEYKN